MRHAVGKKRTKSRSRTATKKRHSRKVSGILGKGDLMMALGLVAGGIAAREANNIIQKTFPGTSLNIVAAGQVALGFALPHFVKNSFVKSMGQGMMVIGGTQFAVNLGVISGMDAGKYSYRINGAGTSSLKAINGGTSRLQAVNGTSELQAVNGSLDKNEMANKASRSFGNYAY